MSDGALIFACAGALLAAFGAGAQLLPQLVARSLGFGLLLLAWVALVASLVPSSLTDRWPFLVAAGVIAFAVAWWLEGALAGREHWLLAFAAGAAIFRVPVPTGDGTAMLLLPIYLAIGVGSVAVIRRALRDRGGQATDRRIGDRGWATRLLDAAVALQVLIAAVSMCWSIDRAGTTEALAFFLVPFLLGYLLIRRWIRGSAQVLPAAWALLTGVGVAAVVGLLQAITHEVWWNPKVIDANRFRADFRTNSLFWDPNIFGRSLVYGIVALVAIVLVGRFGPRGAPAIVAFGALLLTALWTTYSQSSWFALAAALAALGVLTLPPNVRRWVAGAIIVACIVVTPMAIDQLRGRDASGRRDVVEAGLDLARDRPVAGWGAGAFETAAIARAREDGQYNSRLTASHTTPVTVGAELGALGIAGYVMLLIAAIATILTRWRRSSTPAGWPTAPVVWASGAFVAVVAHSLLYAAFYEDPLMWAALGILATLPAIDAAGRAAE